MIYYFGARECRMAPAGAPQRRRQAPNMVGAPPTWVWWPRWGAGALCNGVRTRRGSVTHFGRYSDAFVTL